MTREKLKATQLIAVVTCQFPLFKLTIGIDCVCGSHSFLAVEAVVLFVVGVVALTLSLQLEQLLHVKPHFIKSLEQYSVAFS